MKGKQAGLPKGVSRNGNNSVSRGENAADAGDKNVAFTCFYPRASTEISANSRQKNRSQVPNTNEYQPLLKLTSTADRPPLTAPNQTETRPAHPVLDSDTIKDLERK